MPAGALGHDNCPQNLPKPQLDVLAERGGGATCLRLILGEMQAAQLLHPHVGVPQLRHVVAQGQDAVGTMRKGFATPLHSPPNPVTPPPGLRASQREDVPLLPAPQAVPGEPTRCRLAGHRLPGHRARPDKLRGGDTPCREPGTQANRLGEAAPAVWGSAPLTPLYRTGTGWPGWAFSSRGLLDRGS